MEKKTQIRVTNTGYLGPKKKKFLCDTVVQFPFLHHTVYKDKCVDNSRQHFLAFNVSPLKLNQPRAVLFSTQIILKSRVC